MSRADLSSVPSVQVAQPDEAEALGTLIGLAFRELAPSRWLIPDSVQRVVTLPGYFTMFVEHAFTVRGRVLTTPDRRAVAVWIDAGLVPPQDQIPRSYHARLIDLVGGAYQRFETFDQLLTAAHPNAPHWYLQFLAVHPDDQGHGIGSALLTHMHHQLDDSYHTAYLEAVDESTVDFYTRHGYHHLGDPITLPGGPRMWPMLRRPRPDAPPAWAAPHR